MLNGGNMLKKGSKVKLMGRGSAVSYPDVIGRVNDVGCEVDRFGSITTVIEVDWPEGIRLHARWRASDLRCIDL